MYAEPDFDPTDQASFYSKARSCEILDQFLAKADDDWLCDPIHVGKVARSMDQVQARVAKLADQGFPNVVIKGVFGTSGRNMVRTRAGVLEDSAKAWLGNMLATQPEVIVEPWLDKLCDLSLRMRIVEPGRASVQGIGRFLTDSRGQYRGAIIGQPTLGFDTAMRRFMTADGHKPRRLSKTMHRLAEHVATCLEPTKYTGLVGVDALVFREGERLRLKPIVEINARPNMGHVAHNLERLVHHRRAGLWMILPVRELTRAGFDSARHWETDLARRAPAQLDGGPNQRLVSGALFTTDPDRARAFVSVLVVGSDLSACAQILSPLQIPEVEVRGGSV